MKRALLEGPETSLPTWLGPAWCGLAGYMMGTSVLASVLMSENFAPNGPVGLLVVGLAPGILSFLAGWLGRLGQRVATTVLLTMVGAVLTSLFCAPFTWTLLAVTGGGIDGPLGSGDGAAGTLMLVTIIGAFIAAPLGVLFGLVFTLALTSLRVLSDRPSRSAADGALMALGLGLCAVAAASLVYLFDVHTTMSSGWPSGVRYEVPSALAGVCAAIGAGGGIAAFFGAARSVLRHRAVSQIRDGRSPGWALVDAADVEDAPALPRLFSFAEPGAVLIRCETTDRGPFRSGETGTPVARV